MQEPLIRNNSNSGFETNREDSELDTCLAGYDYELPQELIAQNPVVPRDSSRLLVVNPDTGLEAAPQHHIFRDLPDLLQSGDLLIMNDTRVIPARLYGYKQTGAEIEVLLLEERQPNCWLALVKPGKRFKPGAKIVFEPGLAIGDKRLAIRNNKDFSSVPSPHSLLSSEGTPSSQIPSPQSLVPSPQLTATVLETDEATGGRLLQFDLPEGISLVQLLDEFGEVPLPPYITASDAKSEQYQTVYAQHPGAVAAPTAGLHFTPELLERLQQRGIDRAFVTLHVGVGTFRPVEVEDIKNHKMHEEWIEVPSATVDKIRMTQASGGRIIAIGTTVVRALEGAASQGELKPFCGKTDMFIYPGYKWQVVDGLITNFHLPRSSLLMLVSALIGRQKLLRVYQEAVASRYRFYSFGDAMLILPSVASQK